MFSIQLFFYVLYLRTFDRVNWFWGPILFQSWCFPCALFLFGPDLEVGIFLLKLDLLFRDGNYPIVDNSVCFQVDEVRREVAYFNAYVRDVRRPAQPEPSSRAPPAPQHAPAPASSVHTSPFYCSLLDLILYNLMPDWFNVPRLNIEDQPKIS